MTYKYKWTIKQEGDLCFIRREDGLEVPPTLRAALRQGLATYWIVGADYDDVCRQLDGNCRAEIRLSPVRGVGQP
jgi:hypothetical protein